MSIFTQIKAISAISVFALSAQVIAAPNYPFPQNKAYPYGTTFKAANTAKITEHFNKWKNAWYTEAGTHYPKYAGASESANKSMPSGTARIISPNAKSELTVSEGIAYGMLIMVYMSSTSSDHQKEFDKLFRYWKCYGYGLGGNGCDSWSGEGMEWEIDNYTGSISTGSASDAEFDAAIALIMAYKQWGDASYLTAAKKLISWIKSKDMNSDYTIRPGSNWNDAYNPSYANVAAFQLFSEVSESSSDQQFWQNAITTAISHLKQCQNTTTGLMPDWCDWSSHAAVLTSANVSSGYKGFFDDAARTPWRMAQGYYWYGIQGAKEVNDNIVPWLNESSYEHASMILPGYYLDGTSPSDIYVSSTYSGGLGMAMTSADAAYKPENYSETLYETLINTSGKDSLRANSGEEYFASTLNILYLLTLTGNMPNFYNMTGYTAFTPNTADIRMPSVPEGTLLERNAPNAVLAGQTNWGAYYDNFGQTSMYPDSGSSGLYMLNDGSIAAQISLRVAPEPDYVPNVTLSYPFAGIALSFAEDESYFDLTDLATIRITYKSQGVMRLALLTKNVLDNNEEGGDPGYYLHPTENYKVIEIDATADSYGDFKEITYPSWANASAVDSREVALKNVRGIKIDAKMTKGGFGSLSWTTLELLNAEGKIIAALDGTMQAIGVQKLTFTKKAFVSNKTLVYRALGKGAKVQVFDLTGQKLNEITVSGNGSINLESITQNKGAYVISVKDGAYRENLRITR